jgi:DNA (cytosine-5)-methyltransferase 1
MNELALFAGAGGGILGGHLLGWRTVCAVEWEPYPASVLCARQNDGFLPPFPVWDDVQTFDGKPWRGIVDVVSGGFPCQDISAAGKGEGIDGERSGMWREMARIIHEVRPRFVFVENSPMLTSRGLGRVLGDLASMGFNARWGVLGAADVGAPHQRDRIWIAGWRDVFPHAELHRLRWREQQSESPEEKTRKLANTKELFCDGGNDNTRKRLVGEQVPKFRDGSWEENVSDPNILNDAMRGNSQDYEKSMGIRGYEPRGSISHSGSGCQEGARQGEGVADPKRKGLERHGNERITTKTSGQWPSNDFGKGCWWSIEPDVGRVADGVAARVDRLKAIGNGQVSEVARTAWEILGELQAV